MKVLNIPKPSSFQTKCIRCGALLEIEKSDLVKTGSDKDGSWGEFVCAHCKSRLIIHGSLIPKDWYFKTPS